MTKRYPLRGTFGRCNPRDPRHFQRIALGILQTAHGAHHPGRHAHKRVCDGRARGHGFGGHVHHADFAASAVVGKLCHLLQIIGGTSCQGPDRRASTSSPERSGCTALLQCPRVRRSAAERKLSLRRRCPGGQRGRPGSSWRGSAWQMSPEPCQRNARHLRPILAAAIRSGQEENASGPAFPALARPRWLRSSGSGPCRGTTQEDRWPG